jgi:hypothetical protein
MDDAISTFIFETSRIRPQPHGYRFDAWMLNVENSAKTQVGYGVEMYINFMIPEVEDIPNYVSRYNTHFAISSLRRLPSQLPPTFIDSVVVYKMVSTQFPGYVELHSAGRMLKRPNENSFTFLAESFQVTLFYQPVDASAYLRYYFMNYIHVSCLEWPPEAAEWPTRKRRWGRPDDVTIHHVVNNGCDLRPRCRHSCNKKAKTQLFTWFFTFPAAETLLLNAWTPVQQTVYHVLRVIITQEFAHYVCTNGYIMLSVHHLKAHMLWLCEEKKSEYWTSSTLLRTCVNVFEALSKRCERYCLQGYFLKTVNLFECLGDTSPSNAIVNHLKMFADISYFTDWMISNYLSRCVETCPDNVRLLFHDVSTLQKMKRALTMAAESRVRTATSNSFRWVVYIAQLLPSVVDNSKYLWSLNTVVKWRKDLQNTDRRFDGYFATVVCLVNLTNVKLNASSTVSDEACDMMTAMVNTIDKSNKLSVVQKSYTFQLKKAAYLLRVISQTPCAATRSLLLVLTRIHLRRAQTCRSKSADAKVAGRLLFDVYLAIVYYAAGRYRAAERCCRRVTASPCGRNLSSGSLPDLVEGQLLHRIDDGASTVSGLVVLYQVLRSAALNRPNEASRADVFTAKVFACHLRLSVRVASGRAAVKSYLVQQYGRHMHLMKSLSCGDCLLYYNAFKSKKVSVSSSKGIVKRSPMHFTASALCLRIVNFSVEQLTLFQQTISRDYPTEYAVVASDIKAMNAYRRGLYEVCLRLSRQNVDCLWGKSGFYRFPLSGCMTHLMDDDLASLSGVILLVAYSFSRASVAQATTNVSITQITLSLYLLVQSQMKLERSKAASTKSALQRVQSFYLLRGFSLGGADAGTSMFIYRKAMAFMRRVAEGLRDR